MDLVNSVVRYSAHILDNVISIVPLEADISVKIGHFDRRCMK